MEVRDLSGNEYAAQLTHTWEGELNGNQELKATVIPSKVNKEFIHDIAQMWVIIDDDNTEYKIIYCKRKGAGNTLTVEIRAIPLFFDDFDTQRIYERYDEHMTDTRFFSLVFEGSGYNYILNGTFYAQDWEGVGDGETRLSLFQRGLERYKAEFRISGNTVYLENQIGRDTQFQYRYRLNASNITQEIDAAGMYTYARGYGDYEEGGNEDAENNAGLIREYISPLAEIIGIREAPPIKNGSIRTTEQMDEQLKILVDESLKISVSSDIHDLRKQGYALAQPQNGDRVFLIDERIGLNEEVRIVNMSVTKNWKDEIIALNLTFGSEGIAKRYQSSLKAAADSINQLLEGNLKLPFSVYDARMQEATNAMTDILTQLTVLDNGSLAAIDKDDPNNMVIYNANGLFISEDGGATPKQAIWGVALTLQLSQPDQCLLTV
ncbi:phage tail protein [Virgibacillus sp. CBA3643]|uniref:phage tail protein n=1 Tax=Virgibacillus sp. CBA3643 TaxID=2942278 RepID=UPI0035A375FA